MPSKPAIWWKSRNFSSISLISQSAFLNFSAFLFLLGRVAIIDSDRVSGSLFCTLGLGLSCACLAGIIVRTLTDRVLGGNVALQPHRPGLQIFKVIDVIVMQQWWQREIVAATWSINKEKRIQQQKKQRQGVLHGSCHLYCVRWTRPVGLEHGWSWLRTSNLGFRQHDCNKCICVCILVYCIVAWSSKEQHGPWSWIVGVGISVFSSANYQLRIHSIGAGPSEDVLKGLCIGASLHIFTSHMYSDIDIVNVNHILIWRRQMVFPKEVRRCWALMSQTSQISIDPSFWIATLLTISCSLTAWLLRANLDPETATTSDWSKNSWRWIVPNGSSSDHLCCQNEMLEAAQLWKDVEALAEENNISTIAEHLEQPPALQWIWKNMTIWNNLSLLHFTDATKAHLSSEILPPSPVRCHPPWTGMNPWRLGMALYFFH